MNTECLTATQIPGLSNITAIAQGWFSSLALDNTGHVWGLGSNGYGQLGNTANSCPSGTSICSVPVQIPGLSNITAIAGGADSFFTLALDNAGHVWGLGKNDLGELGNTLNGGSCPLGSVCSTPSQIPGLSNIAAIAATGEDTLALQPMPLRSTSTTVACTPASDTVNSPASCTATVTDTAGSGASTPAGSVSFSNGGAAGNFATGGVCTLSSGACMLSYT